MEKSKVYIYHIICLPTGKGYVGSTINTYKRKSGHFEQLRKNIHHNQYLQNSYNKYGEKSFEFKVIFECIKEYRNKIEEWFINISDFNSEFNIMLADKKDYSVIHDFKTLKREDLFKIIELIKEGCGLSEISHKMKKSISTIRKIFNDSYFKDLVIPDNVKKFYRESLSNNKKQTHRKKAKEVYVYKTNGEFFGKFDSIPNVVENMSFNKSSVMNALQRGIQLKGYLFFREPKIFTNYIPNIQGTDLLVYDNNFNFIDSLKYMKKAQEKYNINMNAINNSCNRLQICNKEFYFVRKKDEKKFYDKFNVYDKLKAFEEDKIALRLLDNELGS